MRESASPELHRLMHRANDLKQHMRHRLDQILHSRRYEGVLQEDYFAQREGRYVVPIKTDMQGKIPGIVHDVSASGATVFLEPRELVELNNSIKVVDLEVEREVRRILRELSAMIAPHTAANWKGAWHFWRTRRHFREGGIEPTACMRFPHASTMRAAWCLSRRATRSCPYQRAGGAE